MLAEARSRGYGLLGHLLLRGLTPDSLPRLRQTPLSAMVPEDADLDRLAAAHYRLLSMEIHPYASLFLTTDPAGCIDPIRDAARSAGFHIDAASARPDHLGIGLLLLSFLTGATADALADDKSDVAAQTEALAQSFLSTWLTPWLAPLQVAVAAHDGGLWAAVVDTAVGLAADHWDGSGALVLPESAPLLDEARTDLRAIATFLLTPCRCGVYLSRADIGQLSRGVAVPRGFGSRQQELTNLLRTSSEYGELGALMHRLDGLMAKRSAEMSGAHAGVWQARIEAARGVVQTIRGAVEAQPHSNS